MLLVKTHSFQAFNKVLFLFSLFQQNIFFQMHLMWNAVAPAVVDGKWCGGALL
jgi:hypothetical protein